MFSSNQVLEISGPIDNNRYLCDALDFALKMSGDYFTFIREEKKVKCIYQISKGNAFCIGWSYDAVEEGWQEFPFDFDLNIITLIIIQHLVKQDIRYGERDGSYEKGFKMKVIEKSFAKEKDNIINPFYGIVKIEPFTCFYAK